MKKSISSLAIVLLLPSAVWAGSLPAEIPSALLGRLSEQTPFPSEWLGVWDFETQIKDCETQQVFSTFSERDTLCPNDDVLDEDDFEYECTGTITETSYQLVCTGTYEEPAGCTVDVDVSMEGTRTGNSFSSTGTFSFTYTGETCPVTGTFCSIIETSGTRVSTSTEGCETAVEGVSWGRIKSVYH